MTFFKTDFPECSILHHMYFVLTFVFTQKVNDRQFLRFLDLYYFLICLKSLSHGLALLEYEPTVCSTVDVLPEGSPVI